MSEAVKVAENDAAVAAAAAGAECVVRYFGHAIHKGLRGSQICIQMEALGPSLLDLIRQGNRSLTNHISLLDLVDVVCQGSLSLTHSLNICIYIGHYRGAPLPLVKMIARDALRGLHFLHTQCGIVHTDIKPENLVLAVGEEIGTHYRSVGQEPRASALDTPEEGVRGCGGRGSEEVLLAAGGDGTVGGAGGVRGSVEGEGGVGVENLQGLQRLQELQELREFVYRKKGGWLERLCAFVEASRVSVGGGVGGGGREVRTEIVDLGNSCLESKPFTEEIQTIEYRSPEVILRAGNAILKS